jgi:hypothetical protein
VSLTRAALLLLRCRTINPIDMLFLFVAGRKQTITVFVGETSRGLLPLREIIQHGSFCAIRNQTRKAGLQLLQIEVALAVVAG